MTTALSKFLLIFLLAGLIPPGFGQAAQKPLVQMSASARQLIAIKVVGSKRFPEAAIAAATALQLGTEVVDDDFKKAARNLGDTGVFTDIAYSFSYSSAGTKVVRIRVLRGSKVVDDYMAKVGKDGVLIANLPHMRKARRALRRRMAVTIGVWRRWTRPEATPPASSAA